MKTDYNTINDVTKDLTIEVLNKFLDELTATACASMPIVRAPDDNLYFYPVKER